MHLFGRFAHEKILWRGLMECERNSFCGSSITMARTEQARKEQLTEDRAVVTVTVEVNAAFRVVVHLVFEDLDVVATLGGDYPCMQRPRNTTFLVAEATQTSTNMVFYHT